MDKFISSAFKNLIVEFGLIFVLYCWNWLGSNLLPEILQVFLVFDNVKNAVIEEATRSFNLFGLIIAGFLRGWIYFIAHFVALNCLIENCYKPLDFSKESAFLCNTAFIAVVLVGVAIVGVPDKGGSFIAAYYVSAVLAIFVMQISYNTDYNKHLKEREQFRKDFVAGMKDEDYYKEAAQRYKEIFETFYGGSDNNDEENKRVKTQKVEEKNIKPINRIKEAKQYYTPPKKENKIPDYYLNNLISFAHISGLDSLPSSKQRYILEHDPEEYNKLKNNS